MPGALEFLDPEQGLLEVLLISGETSPLVTPERVAELHERGMLARPPHEIEGFGTLLVPSKNQTVASLKRYLVDIGGPMGFNA